MEFQAGPWSEPQAQRPVWQCSWLVQPDRRHLTESRGPPVLPALRYEALLSSTGKDCASEAAGHPQVGTLKPADNIVLVITLSAHRQAAFEAADFLMDFLKSRAPFWKKEDTGASAVWVDAKETDEDAFNRWKS